MKEFILPIRVYYEDTDAEGVVYYANYLKYMDRARTEWSRQVGFSLSSLAEKGVILIVRNVWLEYLQPAKLDDLLEVVTSIDELSKVKIVFEQVIRSADDPKQIYCKGLVTVVSVNRNLKPCKLLPEILEGLKGGN